jgi:hypothetical protein
MGIKRPVLRRFVSTINVGRIQWVLHRSWGEERACRPFAATWKMDSDELLRHLICVGFFSYTIPVSNRVKPTLKPSWSKARGRMGLCVIGDPKPGEACRSVRDGWDKTVWKKLG